MIGMIDRISFLAPGLVIAPGIVLCKYVLVYNAQSGIVPYIPVASHVYKRAAGMISNYSSMETNKKYLHLMEIEMNFFWGGMNKETHLKICTDLDIFILCVIMTQNGHFHIRPVQYDLACQEMARNLQSQTYCKAWAWYELLALSKVTYNR